MQPLNDVTVGRFEVGPDDFSLGDAFRNNPRMQQFQVLTAIVLSNIANMFVVKSRSHCCPGITRYFIDLAALLDETNFPGVYSATSWMLDPTAVGIG